MVCRWTFIFAWPLLGLFWNPYSMWKLASSENLIQFWVFGTWSGLCLATLAFLTLHKTNCCTGGEGEAQHSSLKQLSWLVLKINYNS